MHLSLTQKYFLVSLILQKYRKAIIKQKSVNFNIQNEIKKDKFHFIEFINLFRKLAHKMQGHILKFLQNQQVTVKPSRRFFPDQKYGHSKQSPQWFKKKFSLHAQRGYEYKHDSKQIKDKFAYKSQRNNFFVGTQIRSNSNRVSQDKVEGNGLLQVNNRKKGLLSEYLDKNAWMKEIIPLAGVERGQEGRRLNNSDREKLIETMREKKSAYIASRTQSNFYSSKFSKLTQQNASKKEFNPAQTLNPQTLTNGVIGKSILQTSHARTRSIPFLINQKQQIRQQRLTLALTKIHPIQKIQFNQNSCQKFRTLDSEFVQQRMTQTARDWAGKKTSPQKSIERFDSMIGWATSNGQRSVINKKFSLPVNQDITDLFQGLNFVSNQL